MDPTRSEAAGATLKVPSKLLNLLSTCAPAAQSSQAALQHLPSAANVGEPRIAIGG